MDTATELKIVEIVVQAVTYIVIVCGFIWGIYYGQQYSQKQIEDNQKKVNESFDNLSKQIDINQKAAADGLAQLAATFKEALATTNESVHENFQRLERKQDKYNTLQERMAAAEQGIKSAHHRQDELVNRLNQK